MTGKADEADEASVTGKAKKDLLRMVAEAISARDPS